VVGAERWNIIATVKEITRYGKAAYNPAFKTAVANTAEWVENNGFENVCKITLTQQMDVITMLILVS